MTNNKGRMMQRVRHKIETLENSGIRSPTNGSFAMNHSYGHMQPTTGQHQGKTFNNERPVKAKKKVAYEGAVDDELSPDSNHLYKSPPSLKEASNRLYHDAQRRRV